MKLGLITDVHEHVEHLRVALEYCRKARVDRIVFIGDVVAMTERIEETCRLLADARVVGVWGNHDFGLCFNVSDEMRKRYSSTVIDFMTSLKPRLEIDGCLFAHIEPWLDPENIADLWYFGGPANVVENLDKIFGAGSHRFIFAGHYHQWLLAQPTGVSDWNGDQPVQLNDGRYFAVVGALCEGWMATFDTETGWLVPVNVSQ